MKCEKCVCEREGLKDCGCEKVCVCACVCERDGVCVEEEPAGESNKVLSIIYTLASPSPLALSSLTRKYVCIHTDRVRVYEETKESLFSHSLM